MIGPRSDMAAVVSFHDYAPKKEEDRKGAEHAMLSTPCPVAPRDSMHVVGQCTTRSRLRPLADTSTTCAPRARYRDEEGGCHICHNENAGQFETVFAELSSAYLHQ